MPPGGNGTNARLQSRKNAALALLAATARVHCRSLSYPYSRVAQREGAQPPLWRRGLAPTENTLIKMDIDAQRQRVVGWSDWLDLFPDIRTDCAPERK